MPNRKPLWILEQLGFAAGRLPHADDIHVTTPYVGKAPDVEAAVNVPPIDPARPPPRLPTVEVEFDRIIPPGPSQKALWRFTGPVLVSSTAGGTPGLATSIKHDLGARCVAVRLLGQVGAVSDTSHAEEIEADFV